MSHLFSNRTSVCNVICAVLLLILLVFQFTPFWHYGEDASIATSINGYIWFPTENTQLENYLKEQLNSDFSVESILAMPIIVLLAGAIGFVLCLIKADNPIVSLLPAAAGAVGVWGYLTKGAFKLGANWQIHLILCFAILVIALVSLISGLKDIKQ